MKKIVAFLLIATLILSCSCTKKDDEDAYLPSDESTEVQDDETTNKESSESSNADENKQNESSSDDKQNDSEDKEQNPQQKPSENKDESNQKTQQNQEQEQKPQQNGEQSGEQNGEPEQKEEQNQQPDQEDKIEPIYDDSNANPASDFGYVLDKEENRVVIKEYIGDKKDVIIPNYIEGYPVKSIATTSFHNTCAENITIPENVEKICPDAFTGSIKTITIKSKSLTIFMWAFSVGKTLEKVTFMCDKFEDITGPIFYKCPNLKEVVFLCDAPKFTDAYDLTKIFPEKESVPIKYKKGTNGWEEVLALNKDNWDRPFIEIE